MNDLSGMDASLLYFETPEMPMHVGSLQNLDLPTGYAGDFYEDVNCDVAARMHLAGGLLRKPAVMPFEPANHNKMHHAAIDGQAGVGVTMAFLGALATRPCQRPSSRRARYRAPTGTKSAWPSSRARP